MFSQARRSWLLVLASCTRAGDSNLPPPPPPPPPSVQQTPRQPTAAVAPPDTGPPTLAIDGPSSSTPSNVITGSYGVLWRTRITSMDRGLDDTEGAFVIGNEVFVSTASDIQVFDLATGGKLRTAPFVDTQLVAARDALVARNNREVFGLDKRTLRPTWRAPAPNYLGVVGDYVLETPPLSQRQLLRLRRASDGVVMWENDERLFAAVGTPPQLDGDTLYVQAYVGVYSDRIAAIDVASGVVRWRAEGYLGAASGGRVVIQDAHAPPPSCRILDATGHVRWRAAGAWVWLQGDTAYASTSDSLTVIDLASNRVRWRRANLSAFEGYDRWLYGRTSRGVLEIVERITGEIVGEMQLGFTAARPLFHGPPVVRVGGWLFALGPRSAPERRKPVAARGCLIVMGCPGNSYALPGAKVTIDDATVATTDRRGCFNARASLGLGPARVEVALGSASPMQLDGDFPGAVVFDGSPVTLRASYIGAGCHDSRAGELP